MHGRFGKPCPVCGSPVQRIVYAQNEANYCVKCQTGGKLLADRALSQLLRTDWPKTLEELEERKAPGAGLTPRTQASQARPHGRSSSSRQPSVAGAAQTALDLPPAGKPEFSLFAGFGYGIRINRGRTEEQLLMVQPQAGRPDRTPVRMDRGGALRAVLSSRRLGARARARVGALFFRSRPDRRLRRRRARASAGRTCRSRSSTGVSTSSSRPGPASAARREPAGPGWRSCGGCTIRTPAPFVPTSASTRSCCSPAGASA